MKDIITRILVPTDFSDTSDAALDYARVIARRFGATLHLVHVLEDPLIAEGLAAEAYIAEQPSIRAAMADDARQRLAHRSEGASVEVVFGHGAATIVDYAQRRGFDLIVMGTHGRTGIPHMLMGSVAEKVVRTAPCPVLTVGHVGSRAHEQVPVEVAALRPA
jgi:nucleotide-binding universal stress UspA family protein